MRMFLSLSRLRAEQVWKSLAATAAVLVASLAYAECSTDSLIADDSISVSVTAVDDSGAATKLAWLLDQGLEQLFHSELIVVSSDEPRADKQQQECPSSAFRVIGGVQADGDLARVSFQLIDAANSDVMWMESFDRYVDGDVKAIADELAYLASNDIVEFVSGKD